MNSTLFIAIFAGLGGMLGWGLADLFAKKTIDEIGDIPSLVWAHIFGTILILTAALWEILFRNNLQFDLDTRGWIGVILFGILQGTVYLFVYKGFGKGPVAVLNPIFASFTGVVAIISIIFLGEVANLYNLLSLLIIFTGVLILSTDLSTIKSKNWKFISTPGSKEVIIATFLAAIWTLAWNFFINSKNWLFLAALMYVFMTIFIIAVAKIKGVSLKIPPRGQIYYLFFIGLFEVLAYIAISLGYSLTPHTSVVAVISGAFSLPTILLARSFLKEQISRTQTIGGFVVILGIILLFLI
jgi:drug/metabolite transporter (DMT)-like permease